MNKEFVQQNYPAWNTAAYPYGYLNHFAVGCVCLICVSLLFAFVDAGLGGEQQGRAPRGQRGRQARSGRQSRHCHGSGVRGRQRLGFVLLNFFSDVVSDSKSTPKGRVRGVRTADGQQFTAECVFLFVFSLFLTLCCSVR